MTITADFQFALFSDGVLQVAVAPPAPIGGLSLRCVVQKRFGGVSGIVIASVASGYNGQSGITITNSGQGVFNVTFPGVAFSGFPCGLYASTIERLDSGSRTVISQGFLSITPGGPP